MIFICRNLFRKSRLNYESIRDILKIMKGNTPCKEKENIRFQGGY